MRSNEAAVDAGSFVEERRFQRRVSVTEFGGLQPLWFPHPKSENVPRAQLNLARGLVAIGIGRKNLSKIRCAKNVTGNIEGRMIKQVEEIPVKLQAPVFGAERHALRQTEIEICEPWPRENIPALRSEKMKTGRTHRR